MKIGFGYVDADGLEKVIDSLLNQGALVLVVIPAANKKFRLYVYSAPRAGIEVLLGDAKVISLRIAAESMVKTDVANVAVLVHPDVDEALAHTFATMPLLLSQAGGHA